MTPRGAGARQATCLGSRLQHHLVPLLDALCGNLHVPQRVTHQDVCTCTSVKGHHADGRHQVALFLAGCALVQLSTYTIMPSRAMVLSHGCLVDACLAQTVGRRALTCIVQHDVGPAVLERLVQRCLRSVEVLGVTCACYQQYTSSLEGKQRLGAMSRTVMGMAAPKTAT